MSHIKVGNVYLVLLAFIIIQPRSLSPLKASLFDANTIALSNSSPSQRLKRGNFAREHGEQASSGALKNLRYSGVP